MHGEIELDAGKAESLGIKDGDTKAFKIVFGRERCGGNARQRRKHRRTRTPARFSCLSRFEFETCTTTQS